jgi:uncharacterized spore protein YtfJ
MDADLDKVMSEAAKSQKMAVGAVEKLFKVTEPGAVFSEPISAEGITVITASEVAVGMGYGYGIGSGTGTGRMDQEEESEEESESQRETSGVGGGGGGGGFSAGRPVAVVSVGPGGVRVDPVVDATKIGLAFLTAFGSMFLMLGRMRKASRR